MAELDEETLRLVLELHRADYKEELDKIRCNDASHMDKNALLAIISFNKSLEEALHMSSDARMARSFANAVLDDDEAIRAATEEDEASTRDREVARQLDNEQGGRDRIRVERQPNTSVSIPDDVTLSKLAGLYNSLSAGEALQSEEGTGNQKTSKENSQQHSPTYNCAICGDRKTFFEVIETPCGDQYCRACIRELFDLASKDESLFPPRCCRQIIPLDTVKIFLTHELISNFSNKTEEYNTQNRTYCSTKTCLKFIPEQCISNRVGLCKSCSSSTCTICKAAAHGGDCPEDRDLKLTLQLAEDEEWKRCPHCKAIVELTHGCNHMTCRCGWQFCYVCSTKWKGCRCPRWEESRLLSRANVLVDRHGTRQGQDRAQQVVDAAQWLRQRHECAHENWRRRAGGDRCEECRDYLPNFLNECRQCQILVCNRCRQNRLR